MCAENMTDLSIDELEEIKRNVVKLLVDRSSDGLNCAFNGLNPWFKWTGVFLCVFVKSGKTNYDVDRCNLHKLQILKLIFILIIFLRLNLK